MPKRASRRSKAFPLRALLLFGLLLLLGGAYAAWYHDTRMPLRGPQDPPLTLVVEPGASAAEVGRSLHAMGLVRHPEVFHLLVLERRASGKIRAGEYLLEGPLSLEDVLDKLLAGAQAVKIHGEYVPVRAEVAILNNLSAHADYAETLEWLKHFQAPPRQTFLVHGEPPAADALRLRIEEQLHWRTYLPEYQECVELK